MSKRIILVALYESSLHHACIGRTSQGLVSSLPIIIVENIETEKKPSFEEVLTLKLYNKLEELKATLTELLYIQYDKLWTITQTLYRVYVSSYACPEICHKHKVRLSCHPP